MNFGFKFNSILFSIYFCILARNLATSDDKVTHKVTVTSGKFEERKDCPKLALLLYDEKSDYMMNNFDRQIPQTLTLIKSILITIETGDCVDVILVSNKKRHYERIKTEVNSWDKTFTGNLHIEFVRLKFPKGRTWMKKIYRPGSTFGIFLPEILPYDSVIYTDTDVLFLRSIRDLWSEMNKFSPSAVAGLLIRLMPTWMVEIPVLHGVGLGAGVMPMNLTRMRERKWSQNVITSAVPVLPKIKFGFEDFLNVYFYKFPEEVHLLTCDWNYWYHRCEVPCEDEESQEGISVLHGNICTFIDEEREPMYRAIYQSFANTNLTSSFSLPELVDRLEAAMKHEKKNKSSLCTSDPTFENLVLKRLRLKIQRV